MLNWKSVEEKPNDLDKDVLVLWQHQNDDVEHCSVMNALAMHQWAKVKTFSRPFTWLYTSDLLLDYEASKETLPKSQPID